MSLTKLRKAGLDDFIGGWANGKSIGRTCDLCGMPIGRGRDCMRRDIPTTEFRGDDKVLFVHKGCYDGFRQVVKYIGGVS